MSNISIKEYKKILRSYNVAVPRRRSDVVKVGESVLRAKLCRRMSSAGEDKLPSANRSRKRRGGLRRTRKRVAVQ
jgi:hypothetical protein